MSTNMACIYLEDGKRYDIFDITYDSCGYPQFLIYRDNQWLRMSAKYFTPVSSIETNIL